ncbi:MAG: AI-2E family transporter [Bacteroidota bacterium]|nr:AI-2E family transporter [Bacteroidota bacterium]MDP4214630.1 AI-2E family transporter [Bacteroidota bacterium]MDP4244713.1 AI-2E family transporter [Bacteroidota bacterium]MDP4256398.1 AI-2E family transporter [Bacteroidota bacterium]MDP4258960.1 AI-2E family transporter [Bacteroidota bacterium]
MNAIPNNAIRQILLLLVIIGLGIVLFSQLQSFLPAALGAYTLFVLLKKWMYILTARYKWKKGLAAGLLMFGSFLVILLPIALLINLLYGKIDFAVQHSTQVLNTLQQFIHRFEHKYRMVLSSGKTMSELTSWGAQTLPQVLGATFNTITTVAVMYFILYFLLIEGRKMESSLHEWLPLKDENLLLLRQETNSLVYSNAIGIPLIALLQGAIALVGYLMLGVSEPLFWFVVTCIASMIPVVGAALAYVPVGILLIAEGNNVRGIIMLAYGFGVVSTVDSIFRFWLQKRIGDVHPMITAFGVILGLGLFGFIGLIFGPILISLFLLLIKIYANEFSAKGRNSA